ncbi:MAG: hypothetical protein QNJ41_27540 [Xenococcaceae cyanobacterium MO_188.B32]|nr:hypothetical protein [Xenococcaceae cyanobacterium MO_188.B32]
MLSGLKQKAVVNKERKVELSVPELPEGTVVEVILLVDSTIEEDETAYLLKSEANKKHLIQALENVKKGKLIYLDIDEYEKKSFFRNGKARAFKI